MWFVRQSYAWEAVAVDVAERLVAVEEAEAVAEAVAAVTAGARGGVVAAAAVMAETMR